MLENPEQDKIFKYLVIGVIILSLIIFIKEIILKPQPLSIPEISTSPPEIKINFEFLRSSEIGQLLPFEKISLPEEIGRQNPFEPY